MRRAARSWLIEFTAEGVNLERLVRMAGERGIVLSGLHRKGSRRLCGLVQERHMPALQELAKQGGWQLRSGRRRGIGRWLQFFHERWLLTAALLAVGVLVWCLSHMMWHIEIEGAGVYAPDICRALAEMHISPPMPRRRVDLGKLRDALQWRYPRIAWIECGWRGTTLVIRPAEGVMPPDPETNVSCDVVAARDAIVHQIVTRAGTAVVAPGDFVRKGDVLIRGEERIFNGETTSVTADGRVTGRVWEGASVQMSLKERATVYTGACQQVWTLRTPWFDLWRLPECDYDCYDVSVSKQSFGGMYLPLEIYAETRMEASQSITMRDVGQVKAEAAEAAMKKLHEKIPEEESLIDIWGNCSMIDTETVLSLAVGEMLVEIGTLRPQSDMAAPDP